MSAKKNLQRAVLGGFGALAIALSISLTPQTEQNQGLLASVVSVGQEAESETLTLEAESVPLPSNPLTQNTESRSETGQAPTERTGHEAAPITNESPVTTRTYDTPVLEAHAAAPETAETMRHMAANETPEEKERVSVTSDATHLPNSGPSSEVLWIGIMLLTLAAMMWDLRKRV